MGHHHGHDHGKTETTNIKVAFFLNLLFTIVEIIGGFFTNSMAILADALHDLGDSLSLGLAWYFQRLSNKKSNKSFTYGYKRYTLIGALVNATVLLVGSVIIISETVPRLFNPQVAHAPGMMLLAVLGIIINGAAVIRLKRGNTINERVVMLHLLEDVLGWIAVLVGAIIMYFFDWPIIDPILSLGIASYVLFNVFRNMRDVMKILLQGVPDNVEHKEVTEYIASIEEIIDFHDLHIWSLDGQFNILSIHTVVNRSFEIDQIPALKLKIREGLKPLNIHHATIEIDLEKEDCNFDHEDSI